MTNDNTSKTKQKKMQMFGAAGDEVGRLAGKKASLTQLYKGWVCPIRKVSCGPRIMMSLKGFSARKRVVD